jgi:hypothetical protein
MTIQQMASIPRDSLFDRLSVHAQTIRGSGFGAAVYRTAEEAYNRNLTELPFLYRATLRNEKAYVAGNGATLDRLGQALGEQCLGFEAIER